MDRVISAYRLLGGRTAIAPLPLRLSADADVGADAIGLMLDAAYVGVSKLREFGLDDGDFGGAMRIAARARGERAHGRYLPGSDQVTVFFPHERGVADWAWTVVHELAHRIWHRTLTANDRETWTAVVEGLGTPFTDDAAESYARQALRSPDRFPLLFFFQKHFGDDLREFKQWLLTRRYSQDLPTDYSAANGTEAFADCVAELVLGRAHLGMGLRRTSLYVKKTLVALLAPYRRRPARSGLLEQNTDDELHLHSQVDLPTLSGPIADWVRKNLDESQILELERRPHVTLVYGLDKRDLPQIQMVGANFGRPIRVLVGAMNYFDTPENDVLYFEALGSSVRELHDALVALPFTRPQSFPRYVPHITVAYLKKGAARKFIGQQPIRQVLTRDSFTIMDQVGIESQVPTVEHDPDEGNPVLLADTGRSDGVSG